MIEKKDKEENNNNNNKNNNNNNKENKDKEKEKEKPAKDPKRIRKSNKISKDYQSELDRLIESKQAKPIMVKHLINIRHLARAYASVQRNRVALELKMQSYVNQFMLKNGMAKLETNYTEVPVVNKETGEVFLQQRTGSKIIPLYEDEKDLTKKLELERIIGARVEEFQSTDFVFRMIASYRADMYKQEKGILEDGIRLLNDSNLLEWCRSVKGLGDVAAMSFAGYIDPTPRRVQNDDESISIFNPTAANIWSYLGIVPGKAMRRGSQGNYNKKVKSIFIGIIAPNIIRSGDYYYKGIYEIKKEYHSMRPDLVALAEKGMKGWRGWIHNMSIRVLAKILISHAFDILKVDYGLEKSLPKITHSNPLPVKPQSFEQQREVLERYRTNQMKRLEKLKLEWANDDTEHKTNYMEKMKYEKL